MHGGGSSRALQCPFSSSALLGVKEHGERDRGGRSGQVDRKHVPKGLWQNGDLFCRGVKSFEKCLGRRWHA